MPSPFLEVVTRTIPSRPNWLARNRASLQGQTDPDFTQTLVVDHLERGVDFAVGNLRHLPAMGEYLWLLDDDDECCYDDLVADLKILAATDPRPDVIMVRMDHGAPIGILPDDAGWRQAPRQDHIGTSAFIVRRAIWNRYRLYWKATYGGDFHFIHALWQQRLHFVWMDVVASRTQHGQNQGRGE